MIFKCIRLCGDGFDPRDIWPRLYTWDWLQHRSGREMATLPMCMYNVQLLMTVIWPRVYTWDWLQHRSGREMATLPICMYNVQQLMTVIWPVIWPRLYTWDWLQHRSGREMATLPMCMYNVQQLNDCNKVNKTWLYCYMVFNGRIWI